MAEKSDAPGAGDLPASIEAAWGLRERPVKGPKPGLSLERIVAAAVAVAASEGIAAVSMGRVAKDLGASTMSLYRYVSAKDELFLLMQEAAMGPPSPLPALEAGAGWREAISEWAWAQRAMFHRNLWMLRIPIAGPPASPHSVAWWEQGLQALESSGLPEGDKISVILLIAGFVRNEALLMSEIAAAVEARGVPPEEVMAGYERTVKRLVDPVRHPALSRLLKTGVMSEPDEPDYEFTFGLARLLDGIEALVRERGR
ncbi:TetR/AcrR family transcriptional regulator C-terminal domain-containing protein [Streptomyces sp. BE308]|uniref:TetR/AcrR family transcriptional regulator C-terminal domain-containing protein n=1 Tax=unclassified Streptomyces TaxID=2593676 RepID=UPI002DD7B0EB|nr:MULTISPECIES: TetR/AcrR family transcriptional regulator C-terminal domain-containing protein [unclassified Streptomyces]MEE1791361.1 TetR/AcrR family transcriptional regulator C-terminal domain-containing protein [Streptomyces sp. BE308]WRZ74056.1 TetR/AcrR family transcriptional regulator [Streptomyces sp. NBC_01237]